MQLTSGSSDKDGIMDDFILGLIESTKELGSTFYIRIYLDRSITGCCTYSW